MQHEHSMSGVPANPAVSWRRTGPPQLSSAATRRGETNARTAAPISNP